MMINVLFQHLIEKYPKLVVTIGAFNSDVTSYIGIYSKTSPRRRVFIEFSDYSYLGTHESIFFEFENPNMLTNVYALIDTIDE